MLAIRLSRVGKQNQAAFRITIAEKSDAVKGASHEILGFYNPSDHKKVEFNKERIEYWISKGAKPSDRVASLLKTNGMSGLDKFLEPRTKKRLSKSAPAEVAAHPAAPAPAQAVEEAAPEVVPEVAEPAADVAVAPEEAPAQAQAAADAAVIL